MNITTNYGALKGVSSLTCYASGSIKECTLIKKNTIITPYGKLIPQYEDRNERRKHIYSLSFYDNGSIKSIALQNQVEVETSIGFLPTERLTFYENGKIKRLFPLNGKLTGYWSEEQEYQLAKKVKITLPIGDICQRIIGICFYDTGEVKSITFWPNEVVEISTPLGILAARIGLSLYRNGKLKSFEPSQPIYLNTPIGKIGAYDNNPIGVHGDSNSLVFNEDGSIKSLLTSTDQIQVTSKNGFDIIYKSESKLSMCNDEVMENTSMCVSFLGNKVRFNNTIQDEYEISHYEFFVKNNIPTNKNCCSTYCSTCNLGGCS